jgi:hypothetical protein
MSHCPLAQAEIMSGSEDGIVATPGEGRRTASTEASLSSQAATDPVIEEVHMLQVLVDNLKRDLAESNNHHKEEMSTIRQELAELQIQNKSLVRQLVDYTTWAQNEILALQRQIARVEELAHGSSAQAALVKSCSAGKSVHVPR